MSILKDRRVLKGISRKELSNITNIPIRTLEAYEQNKRKTANMELLTAYLLCNALDITYEDLLNDKG